MYLDEVVVLRFGRSCSVEDMLDIGKKFGFWPLYGAELIQEKGLLVHKVGVS